MSTKSPTKKPSLMMRLFSTERKSSLIPATNDDEDPHEPLSPVAEEKLRQRRQRLQRLHSMDAATFRDRSKVLDGLDSTGAAAAAAKHEMRRATTASGGISLPISPDAQGRRPSSAVSGKHNHSQRKGSVQIAAKEAAGTGNGNARSPSGSTSSDRSPTTPKSSPITPNSAPVFISKGGDGSAFNGQPEATTGKRMSLTSSSSMSPDSAKNRVHPLLETRPGKDGKKARKLKHKKAKTEATTPTSGIKVDTSRPLDFPTTPETILEYHRQKPVLKANEEWLVVELNEFECLVDSMEIIKIIAKHSKFFEVEPDQLWEEFFEFVEDVPSYDEIINYDVWQEFRDQKYPC